MILFLIIRECLTQMESEIIRISYGSGKIPIYIEFKNKKNLFKLILLEK